jgi:putative ABC transport system permease protein
MAISLYGDFRFATRLLARSPAFAVIAVLSLAVGIGATTAVCSFVDGLLLRPLPAVLERPDELVEVAGVRAPDRQHYQPLSWADYQDLGSRPHSLRGLAAMAACAVAVNGNGPAERVGGLAVTPNYFDLLRLHPLRGRFLATTDERQPVAILGYDLWRREFAANPTIIGGRAALNGKPMTIIGVAPQGFTGTDLVSKTEVWVPLGEFAEVATGYHVQLEGKRDRTQTWLRALGRLVPGSTIASARSELEARSTSLAATYPASNAQRGVVVVPLAETALGFGPQGPMILRAFSTRLAAVAGLVLAVACLNVAGLLVARSLQRSREAAIRISLGATRLSVARQLWI